MLMCMLLWVLLTLSSIELQLQPEVAALKLRPEIAAL
jgi:hypothetical protein